jgi:hypothetical protein
VNFCSDFSVGSSDPFSLSLTQTGLSMTARLSYGPALMGVPTATSILADGTSSFTTTVVNQNGVIINAAVAINSANVGALTGSINEVWTVPGISGEGRLTQNIASATRTSTTTSAVSSVVGQAWRAEKLRMLEHRMRHR